MVRIAHSSIDENRKAKGGKAGDQTGKEVCIRNWYNTDWDCVIRFNDPEMAEKAAQIMEAIALNDNVGYDQGGRNTLLAEAEKVNFDISKIKTKCESDCSSAVSTACIGAGAPKSSLYKWNNCSSTRSLRKDLLETGLVTIFTTTKYTRSCEHALRGDIYLNEGNHVVMVIDNAPGAKREENKPVQNNTSATTQTHSLELGQKVKLKTGAKYYDGKTIPSWVFKYTLYVRRIDGDKIVFSTLKTGAVTGVTKASNLEPIEAVKTKKVEVTASALNVRKGVGTKHPVIKVLKNGTICEIVAEKDNWGELKEGGWISLKYTKAV